MPKKKSNSGESTTMLFTFDTCAVIVLFTTTFSFERILQNKLHTCTSKVN